MRRIRFTCLEKSDANRQFFDNLNNYGRDLIKSSLQKNPRKGSWWLRRGVRVDAMRYWYQYSDFFRFPAIQSFESVPDLFCKIRTLDAQSVSTQMREYNQVTLLESVEMWSDAVIRVMAA